MQRFLLGILALCGAAAPAGAAVITLDGITSVSGGFRFDYQGTLGPDEGVSSGSRFIVFDFGGYVAGSIAAPAGFTATTELTTAVPFMIPGQSDDPLIDNLVFTYNGPDFRTVDGPFAPFDFDGLSAVTSLNRILNDAFATFTIKNNPDAEENTQLIHVGITTVPTSSEGGAAIPEPSTWAMMIGGFGLLGAAMRRRRFFRSVTA